MPEEIAHALGRIEAQIAGLVQEQRDNRENTRALFDKIDALRTDVSASIGRCPIHDARIGALETWRNGMWARTIGIATLVSALLMSVCGLIFNHYQ